MKEITQRTLDGFLKPRRLSEGDAVAIVAPASPLKRGQRAMVDRSMEVLEGWGVRCRMAPALWRRKGYLAGGDQERAAQLRWALQDDEIRGVFCLRGGYGSMRLLTALAPDLVQVKPKVFVGFSDLTALLISLLQISGVVAFHGPSLTSAGLSEGSGSATAQSLFRVVFQGEVPEPAQGEGWIGGRAEGPLVGGCLSLLAALAGTPFAPRLRDAILFLEDVNEPLYRIDRMICQLRLAGMLEGVRGIVVGGMMGTRGAARPGALREALIEGLGFLEVPMVFGVPSGHGKVNLTLPLGCRVSLDGERGLVLFREAGVS